MKEKKNSVLDELFSSFKYYRESKKGKYSLDTYLDIIGEYTDRLIEKSEEESLEFLGGTCEVVNNVKEKTFVFIVKMFFRDENGNNISKEASRSLEKTKFTSETEQDVGNNKIFEINKPE